MLLPEPVYIYGLFLPNGLCFYVGSTIDVDNRKKGHRARFIREHSPCVQFSMRLLSIAWTSIAARKQEETTLRAMRAENRAALNVNTASGFWYGRPTADVLANRAERRKNWVLA